MLSIYVIITAIYLILAVCDAIIGIGFAKHSGPLKLGILTTLIDLFFTLTLLTYASNRYEEPSYGLSALFFILSYLIEIINLFVNKNPLLSDETTLAEVCSGGATLIGCICSISNLKDRFRGAWFLFIDMVLTAMFGGIGKTEQTIVFFSILSAILGLIFIISIYIVGDRKRFLEEWNGNNSDTDYVFDASSAPPSPHHHPGEEPKQVLEPTLTQVEPSAAALKKKKEMLMKLKELLDADILTQEEFDAEKKKILER